MLPKEETLEKILRIAAIPVMACFIALLFPQTQRLIVRFAETVAGRSLIIDDWRGRTLDFSLSAIFCIGAFLTVTTKKLPDFFGALARRHLVHVSIFIIAASIAVRVVMYIHNRSLWMDEAAVIDSVVLNWSDLLRRNVGTAPFLYVVAVKAIGSIFGNSEFSLRLFSFFAFTGFLGCLFTLLGKAFGFDDRKSLFITSVAALLPVYIWYSNELKPYMGDAFFFVFVILLYFFYIRRKLGLPALTGLCILAFGFSYPSFFMTGSILVCEFSEAVFDRNKKRAVSVFAAGVIVIAVFAAYYFWWISPISADLELHWAEATSEMGVFSRIRNIFSPWVGQSNSPFLWYLVPFALLGLFASVKSHDKIARAVAMSLFLVCAASALGKWPLSGRLWLFLPAIVLIYTPAGIDFAAARGRLIGKIGMAAAWGIAIYLPVNSIGYFGDKAYFKYAEVNPLISYVRENIKDGEMLYVYQYAKGTFNYKNDFSAKIGNENITADNVIFGNNWEEWEWEELGGELRSVIEHERVYLLFQHAGRARRIDGGLDALRNHGTVGKVMEAHSTPLYYFEKKSTTIP